MALKNCSLPFWVPGCVQISLGFDSELQWAGAHKPTCSMHRGSHWGPSKAIDLLLTCPSLGGLEVRALVFCVLFLQLFAWCLAHNRLSIYIYAINHKSSNSLSARQELHCRSLRNPSPNDTRCTWKWTSSEFTLPDNSRRIHTWVKHYFQCQETDKRECLKSRNNPLAASLLPLAGQKFPQLVKPLSLWRWLSLWHTAADHKC